MYLNAITVCVDYSDFLAHTIPFNRNVFNYWTIITSKKDVKTQNLCKFWGINVIVSDCMYEDNATFNKAKAINLGIESLNKPEGSFICHLDSDIVLPPNSRRILENIQLDPQTIYGCDRQMVRSYEDWADFLINPDCQHVQNIFCIPNRFDLGVRVAKQEHSGYIPIGFFQLWGSDPAKNTYPTSHTSAARSDMMFALQWDRPHRQLIPELFLTHLESEKMEKMGANWNGRVTRPFTVQRPKSTVDKIMDGVDVKELQS